MTPTKWTAAALVTAGLLAACSSPQSATPAPSAPASAPAANSSGPETQTPVAAEGNWITLADYEADPQTYHAEGDVVLFFNASWCPTCQETVKNLDRQATPAGLTVVSVDYDTNEGLRQEYGVTVQHTFVKISDEGQQQKKFTGSLTGDEIADQAA